MTSQLTLFAADTHASRSLRPGSAAAIKMTAISGQKWLASSTKRGPLGCLQRTLLVTLAWGSIRCFLTWKPAITPGGRILYRLSPSMPTIDETESGLLHTPTATGNQLAPSMRQRDQGSWMWPTPTTEPGGGERSGSRKGTGSLAFEAKMWPPPLARDHKGPGMSKERRETRAPDNLSSWARAKHGSGKLNPWWVEWLMGFPPGWTELKR